MGRDFIISLFSKFLCSLPHEGQRKTEVGNDTHSTEVFSHSRHLLFPGKDNKLLTLSSESVIILIKNIFL
jgi:hypothetical protein